MAENEDQDLRRKLYKTVGEFEYVLRNLVREVTLTPSLQDLRHSKALFDGKLMLQNFAAFAGQAGGEDLGGRLVQALKGQQTGMSARTGPAAAK